VFHADNANRQYPLVYLVMEAEEDLSQVIPTRALLPVEAQQMLPPLLDVISYLHSRGLVHGRIKPSNIMAVDDQLKLSIDSFHSVSDAGEAGLPSTAFDAPDVRRFLKHRRPDESFSGDVHTHCLSREASSGKLQPD
jgi:serine/threonine protein kinase